MKNLNDKNNVENFNEEVLEQCLETPELIARVIWDNPFLSGLSLLSKEQLVVVIDKLTEKLDFVVNLHEDWNYDERDCKDIAFDQKCLIIEALDPDFFDQDKKEGK